MKEDRTLSKVYVGYLGTIAWWDDIEESWQEILGIVCLKSFQQKNIYIYLFKES